MSLTVFIGNKNYSSSSMRAGVLLRAFEIDVQEKLSGLTVSRQVPHSNAKWQNFHLPDRCHL